MAYTIYNSDGTAVLLTLAEGEVDSVTTSLDLIGKNLNNYGQYVNQNFVKLLTNFASPTNAEPISPQVGQLWFNKTTKRLTVYDGNSFKPTYGATVSGTAPITTSTGDLWYDTINSQLKLWNGSSFKLIAPAVSGRDGKFGIEPPPTTIYDDNTGDQVLTAGLMYSYGTAAAFVVPASTASGVTNGFLLSNEDSLAYANRGGPRYIQEGITLFSNLDILGNFYLNGESQVPPIKTLSATVDITQFGDPAGYDLSPYNTSTVKSRIGTANVFIAEQVLSKLFSTNTDFNSTAFPTGSEARVVCQYSTSTASYSTTTSVRRFGIINTATALPIVTGTVFIPVWATIDSYNTPFGASSTFTNIVTLT
jgi:hypothetical protein